MEGHNFKLENWLRFLPSLYTMARAGPGENQPTITKTLEDSLIKLNNLKDDLTKKESPDTSAVKKLMCDECDYQINFEKSKDKKAQNSPTRWS